MLHHLAEMFARRVPTERRLDVLVISGIAAMALALCVGPPLCGWQYLRPVRRLVP